MSLIFLCYPTKHLLLDFAKNKTQGTYKDVFNANIMRQVKQGQFSNKFLKMEVENFWKYCGHVLPIIQLELFSRYT